MATDRRATIVEMDAHLKDQVSWSIDNAYTTQERSGTSLYPFEDQRRAIDYIVENKAVLLKAPTGAGKTLVGVQSAMEADAQVILCIAPLNTVKGWRETVERQCQGTMPFHHITSRAAGKRAHGAVLSKERGFYIIGREYFKRFGWSKLKADFIIYDECHGATNRKSLMWKMLKTAKAPYLLAMSATPFGNKVEGAWALARWLWPKETPRGYLELGDRVLHHREESPRGAPSRGKGQYQQTLTLCRRRFLGASGSPCRTQSA